MNTLLDEYYKGNCGVGGERKKSNVDIGGGWSTDADGKYCWSDLRDKNSEKDLSKLFRDSSLMIKLVTEKEEKIKRKSYCLYLEREIVCIEFAFKRELRIRERDGSNLL